ncbi:MAG: carbon storage regulator CsrA [Candidatus Kapabacteria bacterium]|nr:carbon storage regulator CsrA [Ignavibacteriota bacterium]MCW5884686.1 carbon storage regulator CsrA [Candidatus Kapabacteria bacterium]
MLVLSRKIGEIVTIGNSIEISVLSYDRGVVRLGINAPKSVPVHRKEVHDKIIQLNKQAAKTELKAIKEAISMSAYNFMQSNEDELGLQIKNFTKND